MRGEGGRAAGLNSSEFAPARKRRTVNRPHRKYTSVTRVSLSVSRQCNDTIVRHHDARHSTDDGLRAFVCCHVQQLLSSLRPSRPYPVPLSSRSSSSPSLAPSPLHCPPPSPPRPERPRAWLQRLGWLTAHEAELRPSRGRRVRMHAIWHHGRSWRSREAWVDPGRWRWPRSGSHAQRSRSRSPGRRALACCRRCMAARRRARRDAAHAWARGLRCARR
jgi:hypothetical protein